jgi:hypothetical protein
VHALVLVLAVARCTLGTRNAGAPSLATPPSFATPPSDTLSVEDVEPLHAIRRELIPRFVQIRRSMRFTGARPT